MFLKAPSFLPSFALFGVNRLARKTLERQQAVNHFQQGGQFSFQVCIIRALGFPAISDDKAHRLATAVAAQKDDSILGLLIATYRSGSDKLRIAVFSGIDQAEAFLVKCTCDDGIKVKNFEHPRKVERNIVIDIFEGHTGQEFAHL